MQTTYTLRNSFDRPFPAYLRVTALLASLPIIDLQVDRILEACILGEFISLESRATAFDLFLWIKALEKIQNVSSILPSLS
jgi:hypothetical protein